MLYLKSLSISRFKSFKQAELLFSKGFTCVVGPNGGGKSNICDALMFGLGETSLHRLRADKLDSLIDSSIKRKAGQPAKAYVRIEFTGDDNITIVRVVRSDGKTGYKVNGKHMTRQEVLELLRRHSIHLDETNTILQGEINKIITLSPKERRELIDIASGVKEFDIKKQESTKELDKVGQKISEAQVMLNERANFLRDLEKDKETAEKYIQMTSRIKVLNYSILVGKKKQLQQSLEAYEKELSQLNSKKSDLSKKQQEVASNLSSKQQESQKLTIELSKHDESMGEIGKRLAEIDHELATIDAQVQSNAKELVETKSLISSLNEELARANTTVSQNKATIAERDKQIKALEEKSKNGITPDVQYDEDQISKLNKQIIEGDTSLFDYQCEISKLQAEAQTLQENKRILNDDISLLEQRLSTLEADGKELSSKLENYNSAKANIEKLVKKLEERVQDLNEDHSLIDTKLIEFKEQRARYRPRDAELIDAVNRQFGAKNGFYGKVAELCTFKGEYAYAVESAAGSKFDYLVVEDVSTANSIIEYLKKNNLGRATFIPIKELRPERTQKKDEVSAVVDLVKFDDKFSKVFSYVFNNTYLVEDINHAVKLGLGTARYVTTDGDLIEQSSILSGGSRKMGISLATIENQIKELLEKKESISIDIKAVNEELQKHRKELALMEIEYGKQESALELNGSEMMKAKSELSEKQSHSKKLAADIDRLKKELVEKDAEKLKLVNALESLKGERQKIYDDAIKASKELAKHGISKAEREKLEKLRNELQELNVANAALQKENEMLENRSKELQVQLAEKNKQIKKIEDEKETKSTRKKLLEKDKTNIEEEIRASSAKNKKSYDILNATNVEIARLTGEQGKIAAEISNIERLLGETNGKKNQMETRINDITAELATYTEKIEALNDSLEDMEKEAGVISMRLNELGNVNLKAPEIYAQKSKDVEEAKSKIDTLEIERQSVLRMISEIESRKYETFMNTFNEVNKNFSKLYNYVFPGKASIALTDSQNPFESGLEIRISDGKSTKVLHSMSGGEKSFISIILIFSIHMCKPSPLYIFDEVDSALDKENSKKLSHLIKEMSKEAQFIVVSHNDSLIVNADAAIGVIRVSNDKGQLESKAVGVEIGSILKKAA